MIGARTQQRTWRGLAQFLGRSPGGGLPALRGGKRRHPDKQQDERDQQDDGAAERTRFVTRRSRKHHGHQLPAALTVGDRPGLTENV